MSVKDKAKELIDKFTIDLRPFSEYGEWSEHQAKQCALIALDEMIDIRNGLYINEGSIAHQWLLDVKHEIEKL